MCIFFKSIGIRLCMNIMFMDYVCNENPEKNVDLVKIKNIELIDKIKNERTAFLFGAFKLMMRMKINIYNKHIYSKYSSYFEDFKIITNIKDDNVFVEEFKNKINICNNLFVLYLLYDFLNDASKDRSKI